MSRYTSARHRPDRTFDALLEFKDAGLIAADDNAQVDGADKIVDVGVGLFEADMVIDVSAIEIASNDEVYRICIQGSTSATFASVIENLAIFEIGALEVLLGAADVDGAVGRYIVPFRNERNNTYYRYLRVAIDVNGTIASGINFVAWASRRI